MLLTATLCLLAFGAVMVYSASSARNLLGGYGDGTTYLVRYVALGALALVGMHLIQRHGYDARPARDAAAAGRLVRAARARADPGRRDGGQRRALVDRPWDPLAAAVGADEARARPLLRAVPRQTSPADPDARRDDEPGRLGRGRRLRARDPAARHRHDDRDGRDRRGDPDRRRRAAAPARDRRRGRGRARRRARADPALPAGAPHLVPEPVGRGGRQRLPVGAGADRARLGRAVRRRPRPVGAEGLLPARGAHRLHPRGDRRGARAGGRAGRASRCSG